MNRTYNDEAIAVISMAGKFPGAENLDQFWDNLKNSVESVVTFQEEESNIEGLQSSQNKKYLNADAVLSDIDLFDAGFFDLSPREAEIMDPQHRLFIEICWEAMERAGYAPEKYDGTIGVYAGSNLSSYMLRNLYSNPGLVERIGTFKTMLLNGQDFLSTRVSFLMNLKGPSVNLNTLCSSSFVAIHSACQSLVDYGCDMAIAGGVNIQVSKNEALFYQEGGIGSSDGHCRAFDAKANGTVSGSGLGVVVLKRLEDALKDGDHIEAIIRGSAINNDGSSKNSYTAPNPDGQAECIAAAIAMSEVEPGTIRLIEAHGTGTNLGDPIEIAGLTKAFGAYTDKKQYCAIGSVKTNIGHLVTAGGVASLIKVILAMQNRLIPASLNFNEPSPKIDFKKTPFYVNDKLTPWERINSEPLRAGVSSFGIGGTNVHMIVEEAPELLERKDTRNWRMLTLSAKTETALRKMNENLLDHINQHPDIKPIDLAYTMHVGRCDFNNKQFVLFRNRDELKQNLGSSEKIYMEKPRAMPVIFLIPGYESGYIGMGRQLYEQEPVFSEHLDMCAEIIDRNHHLDIVEYLTQDNIYEKREALISYFVVTYSISQFWISCGVKPSKIAAYGIGLITAACIDGKISVEEGVSLIFSGKTDLSQKWPDKIISLNDESDGLDKAKVKEHLDKGDYIFIEVGPDALISKALSKDRKVLKSISRDNDSECRQFLKALGFYWLWNGNVDWNGYYGKETGNKIKLPTYPFERKRYWIEPGKMEVVDQVKESYDGLSNLHDLDQITSASITVTLDLNNPLVRNQAENRLKKIVEIKQDLEKSLDQKSFKISEVIISRKQTDQTGNNKKLSRQPRPEIDTPYEKYRTDTERVLVETWQEVLGIEKIGIHDNFYALGGHSLIGASIATSLSEYFNMQLPLTQLIEYPTIFSLAKMIDTYQWVNQGLNQRLNQDQDQINREDENMEEGTI